jgi:FkbM family methyltransferase
MKFQSISKFFSLKLRSAKNRFLGNVNIISFVHRSRFLSKISGKKFVANHDIDRKFLNHLDIRNGYFVELGAHDGVTFSNTLHLELYNKWRGLLIEPSPYEYALAVKNRAKRTSVINAACVQEDFRNDWIELIYSGLMTVDTNTKIGSVNPISHAEIGNQFIKADTYKFRVRAATLTKILEEVNAPHKIDLLSLDVEGSELNVLNGLDFQKYQVQYILVETRDINQVTNFLTMKNYDLVDQFSDQDYLFKDTRS